LVKDALAATDGATVRHALEQDGRYDLMLHDGSLFHLEPEDVDVRAASHEELALAQEGGLAVAIDTTVDDELRAEGTAARRDPADQRERKAAGLQISDRITARIAAGGRLSAPSTSTATGSAARCWRWSSHSTADQPTSPRP
jgi:isoleucyl-tRNA synthetase